MITGKTGLAVALPPSHFNLDKSLFLRAMLPWNYYSIKPTQYELIELSNIGVPAF